MTSPWMTTYNQHSAEIEVLESVDRALTQCVYLQFQLSFTSWGGGRCGVGEYLWNCVNDIMSYLPFNASTHATRLRWIQNKIWLRKKGLYGLFSFCIRHRYHNAWVQTILNIGIMFQGFKTPYLKQEVWWKWLVKFIECYILCQAKAISSCCTWCSDICTKTTIGKINQDLWQSFALSRVTSNCKSWLYWQLGLSDTNFFLQTSFVKHSCKTPGNWNNWKPWLTKACYFNFAVWKFD